MFHMRERVGRSRSRKRSSGRQESDCQCGYICCKRRSWTDNHERPEVDQIDERRIRPARLVALACPIPQRVVSDLCEGKQKVHDRKADYSCYCVRGSLVRQLSMGETVHLARLQTHPIRTLQCRGYERASCARASTALDCPRRLVEVVSSAALQQFRPERWVRDEVEGALVRMSSASPSTLQRTDRAGVEQQGSRRRHRVGGSCTF